MLNVFYSSLDDQPSTNMLGYDLATGCIVKGRDVNKKKGSQKRAATFYSSQHPRLIGLDTVKSKGVESVKIVLKE